MYYILLRILIPIYMAPGGGASVPGNGVANLSHRLYNIFVGQYEGKLKNTQIRQVCIKTILNFDFE